MSRQGTKLSYYPLILYPLLLANFLARHPLSSQFDVIATPSIAPKPPKDSKSTAFIWIQMPGFAFIAIASLLRGLGWLNLHTFAIAIAVSSILLLIPMYLREQKRQKYLREKDKFEQALTSLQEQLKKWEITQVETKVQVQKQLKERAALLESLLHNQVRLPVAKSIATRGVSEQFFEPYLLSYFGQLLVIPGEEISVPGNDFNYSTDFTLCEPETGLRFDIEIDEPYEGKSKKPHHCSDHLKDRNRNKFFLDLNWVVIRFSEEQIIRYPKSCCKTIAHTLVALTGNPVFLSQLIEVEPLSQQKNWTYKEAQKFVKWHYREMYLHQTGVFVQRNPNKATNNNRKPNRTRNPKRKAKTKK